MPGVISKVADADRSPIRESMLDRRVLAIWPRLDRRALARCRHDPQRIASLVGRRTNMPPEAILALVSLSDDVRETWFG